MKNILLTIAGILLICTITYGQNAPAIEWQKCLGGSGSDVASAIQQTMDGGFIIAGSTNSFDGDISGNHGNSDYWIVKIDSSATIQWQKCFGGSNYEEAFDVQQTTDGGFIIAGISNSIDGDVSGNKGNADCWIVKLDSSATIQWQKCLGGSYFDLAYGIEQVTDGGFIVAGSSYSADGDVSGHHGTIYDPDCWVVKLDASGIIEWEKSLGGSDYDEAFAIQQTADGGYVVAATTSSNDGDVVDWHEGYSGYGVPLLDYWVVKLDIQGTIQWSNCLGAAGDDWANSIRQTQDGGLIVGGGTIGYPGGDVTGWHGSSDYWIAKLESGGGIEWQKCLGGDADEEANSVDQIEDGAYIITGYTFSDNEDVSGNQGSSDCWVVQLDIEGNIVWQKSLGGSSYDGFEVVRETEPGEFILAGYSYSNNGDVSANHGDYDCWIVQLSCNESQHLFADADADSYGDSNASVTVTVCEHPAGYVTDSTDCNDTNANVNPGAPEILFNDIDDDCDGYIDEFGTGISSDVNDEFIFSLFPNPTNGEFVIYLQLNNHLNSEAKIEVISLLGQVMYNKTSVMLKGKLQEVIKLNDAADGMYLVRVMVNDEVHCRQIVYQK